MFFLQQFSVPFKGTLLEKQEVKNFIQCTFDLTKPAVAKIEDKMHFTSPNAFCLAKRNYMDAC
jgi:hypothetical protein